MFKCVQDSRSRSHGGNLLLTRSTFKMFTFSTIYFYIWPGQGLAWTGQGCASAARNSKGPQKPPFGHQMGRHKRWGGGLDAKFDQNFAPDLFRGVPGVISRLFFDHFLDLKSGKSRFFEKKSCYPLQHNQQNLEKAQILTAP